MSEIIRVIGHVLLIPILLLLEFIGFAGKILTAVIGIICSIGTIGSLFFAGAFTLVNYGTASQRWQLVLIAFLFFMLPTIGYCVLHFIQIVKRTLTNCLM